MQKIHYLSDFTLRLTPPPAHTDMLRNSQWEVLLWTDNKDNAVKASRSTARITTSGNAEIDIKGGSFKCGTLRIQVTGHIADGVFTPTRTEVTEYALDIKVVSEITPAEVEDSIFDVAAVSTLTAACENAAELANINAVYAQGKGDYAKTQGDYAKAKGDAAKTSADSADAATASANAAEAIRVSNESTRQSQEATRQSQESARSQAESARVTAENARVSAETARASECASLISRGNEMLAKSIEITNPETINI